ncbi:MAG: hypothetical protein WBP64_00130 [Nitrososphaeraceae archaeon]
MAYDKVKYVPTVKRTLDELWGEFRLILPPEKPNNTMGRSVVSFRKIVNNIPYVLGTWRRTDADLIVVVFSRSPVT